MQSRWANLNRTTTAPVFTTGGKPSTWFPPGGLVEQDTLLVNSIRANPSHHEEKQRRSRREEEQQNKEALLHEFPRRKPG